MPNIKYQITSDIKPGPGFAAEQGFTLIELLVAVFGFTLIAVGMIGLFSSIFTTYRQQGGLLTDADQARKVAFKIVNELRNAQSAGGSYALATTSAQQLIFFSNEDTDTATERINYFVQNGALWKGVINPTTSPPTYPLSAEVQTKVLDHIANGGNPVFYYYDDSYNGSTTVASLSQPVNPTQVKFVKVSIDVPKNAGVLNNNPYTVIAGGTIRILKTNLGQ